MICRLIIGIVATILFACIFGFLGDVIFALPCAVIACFFIISFLLLRHRILHDRIIALAGICTAIDRTIVKNKIKSIYLQTDNATYRILVHRRVMVEIGDEITVYVPREGATFENNGMKVICDFYAIERSA